MKNIDRISKYVSKKGSNHILIHTVPETGNWIVAEKTEQDNWLMTLMNPLGNTVYNLGLVSDEQHLRLWIDLTRMEIDLKVSRTQEARLRKEFIENFLKRERHMRYLMKTAKEKIRINN